jgi:hypothetical protein
MTMADQAVNEVAAHLGLQAGSDAPWRRRLPEVVPLSGSHTDLAKEVAHPRPFSCSKKPYSNPHMHAELKGGAGGRGFARLMRQNGLKALLKSRDRKTTESRRGRPAAPSLLDQESIAIAPNRNRIRHRHLLHLDHGRLASLGHRARRVLMPDPWLDRR